MATDLNGEVYAIARWCGVKTKDVSKRLGKPESLSSVAQAKEALTKAILPGVQKLKQTQMRKQDQLKDHQEKRLWKLTEKHQEQRKVLLDRQKARSMSELDARQERFSKGLRGLFDRITGAYSKTKRQNELEGYDALKRDQKERDKLIYRHLGEKRDHLKRQHDILHKAQRVGRSLSKDIERLKEDRSNVSSPGSGPSR